MEYTMRRDGYLDYLAERAERERRERVVLDMLYLRYGHIKNARYGGTRERTAPPKR